jgi:hypothetical protein
MMKEHHQTCGYPHNFLTKDQRQTEMANGTHRPVRFVLQYNRAINEEETAAADPEESDATEDVSNDGVDGSGTGNDDATPIDGTIVVMVPPVPKTTRDKSQEIGNKRPGTKRKATTQEPETPTRTPKRRRTSDQAYKPTEEDEEEDDHELGEDAVAEDQPKSSGAKKRRRSEAALKPGAGEEVEKGPPKKKKKGTARKIKRA